MVASNIKFMFQFRGENVSFGEGTQRIPSDGMGKLVIETINLKLWVLRFLMPPWKLTDPLKIDGYLVGFNDLLLP